MPNNELEEKKQRFLQEVQDELGRLTPHQNPHSPIVKAHVAETLLLLREGKYEKAQWPLFSAYAYISPDHATLSMLDLGIFAFRLVGSYLYLHDVVPYLWEKRKDFYPHLSGALRATYWFLCSIEAGHKPEEALERALKVRNELYEMFGDTRIYRFSQTLNMLLTPEALANLRQILMHIYNERQAHRK
jgi:hypothetical protein